MEGSGGTGEASPEVYHTEGSGGVETVQAADQVEGSGGKCKTNPEADCVESIGGISEADPRGDHAESSGSVETVQEANREASGSDEAVQKVGHVEGGNTVQKVVHDGKLPQPLAWKLLAMLCWACTWRCRLSRTWDGRRCGSRWTRRGRTR